MTSMIILLLLITNPIILHYANEMCLQKSFVKSSNNSTFYEYYKQPTLTQIDEKKNLVFIYAEGLERTYFNNDVFPDLMPLLKKLETDSISFTDMIQVPGTGWTIGGLVSSQCGIPLFTYSHGNSMSGVNEFLPSAVCLSDLLAEAGYHISFLGGANLTFAGKGKFLRSHSFNHIYGKQELLANIENKSYQSSWGVYDDSLFDLAYETFIHRSKQNNPFGLFLLTLDTHHPYGHPSHSCQNIRYKNGKNRMLNAVACSDFLINSFIQRIQNSTYINQTIIVLVSDHLAHKNSASKALEKAGPRRNLFIIIDPSSEKKIINNTGSHLDIGPTTLPFLGFQGQYGLGDNLLSASYSPTNARTIHKNIPYWREELLSLWNFPKISEFVGILPNQEKIIIDNQEFSFPILVEFDEELNTQIKFDFFNCCGQKTLIDHVSRMNPHNGFILIDTCKNVNTIIPIKSENSTYCVVQGIDSHHSSFPLKKPIKFTKKEILDKTINKAHR